MVESFWVICLALFAMLLHRGFGVAGAWATSKATLTTLSLVCVWGHGKKCIYTRVVITEVITAVNITIKSLSVKFMVFQ